MLPIPGFNGSGLTLRSMTKSWLDLPRCWMKSCSFTLLPKIRGGIVEAVVCHLENLVVTFTPQVQSWVWGCGSFTGTECYYNGTSTEFYSKACTEFTSVCFHTLLHEVVAVFNLSLLLAVLVALVSNLALSAPVKIICFMNICSNLVWFSMWNLKSLWGP